MNYPFRMTTRTTAAAVLVALGLVGCASAPRSGDRPGTSQATDARPRPADADTANYPWPRMMPGQKPPPYPGSAVLAGVQTRVIVAFVVDEQGKADPSTISFLQHGWTPEFDDAVCAVLPGYRFTWGTQTPKRRPVIMPFDFNIHTGGRNDKVLPPLPDMRAGARELQQLTPPELDAWLATKDHCRSGR